MPVVMHRSSREQLAARLDSLLAEAKVSRADLAAKAEFGTLTGEEFDLWDEVRSIEFLMGDGGV